MTAVLLVDPNKLTLIAENIANKALLRMEELIQMRISYQNSHIDTQTFNLHSQGDAILKGATAKAHRINADIDGTLHIESLQDEHKQNSNQLGLGTHLEFGFGSSWRFSGNANASGGKGDSKQVREQSGLFAEAGGYHVTAENVHLNGGAIASQAPANSELTTNQITFKDIENRSNYGATSGAISGGYSQSGSANANPSLPLHEQGKDGATTKATLTEGKITLNKDSAPTETTAKALGINTDLVQANRQVAQPKDINKLLSEQKVISQNLGHIGTAAVNFTEQQARELENEAKEAEKAGDLQTAQAKRQEAKTWQTGGENKRKVEALTTAINLALAGQSPQAIATGAASPYINQAIKQLTEDFPSLNIPAHIIWGAIEAELGGGSATTGAIAAGVGELGAKIIHEKLYNNKPTEQLTEEEKQNILALSKLAAAVAGGLTATGNSAENLATISQGMKVAKKQYAYYRDLLLSEAELSKVGFEWKALGEVCLPTKNIKWQDATGDFQYIDLASVDLDNRSISDTQTINAQNAPSRAQKLLAQDDVIFATTRPTQMRVAVVPQDFDGQIASTGYCVLRADTTQILPKWIYFNLSTADFTAYLEEHQSGTAYLAISDGKIKDFKIPIPPPPTAQNRRNPRPFRYAHQLHHPRLAS